MIGSLTVRTILTAKKETFNTIFMTSFIIAVFLLYSGILFSHHVGGMDVPMLTVGGSQLSKDRVRCFDPIDNATAQQLKEYWKGKAVFYPFSYYNLQYMYVNMALDPLYLSVLVLPDEFFDTHIAKYVNDGRLPNNLDLECVVGSNAASAWDIKEGQCLDIKLEKNLKFNKVECEPSRARHIKVVGIMSDELNFQFLRGAVILTESTFERLYQKAPQYNCLFVYPFNSLSPIEDIRRYMIKNKLNVFRVRYPFLRSGPPSLIMVVLLCAVGMTFQLSSSSSLERNLKNVGVLISMGANRWRISCLFALVDGIVQFLGIALGLLMAKYVYLLMNLAVMRKGPDIFSTYATHFRLHQPSIVVLCIIIVLSSMLRAGRTIWFLSKTCPDNLIRGTKR